MFYRSAGILDLSNAIFTEYFATSFHMERVIFGFLIIEKEKFCSVTMKHRQHMFAFFQKKKKKTADFLGNEGDYMPVSLKCVEQSRCVL